MGSKETKVKKLSVGEETFAQHIKAYNLPEPEREYRPVHGRRWRFDFAWPDHKLAVEIEGGTWSGGRHTRGDGFEMDCRKYNHAAGDGWRLYRFTTNMVKKGEAIELLRAELEGKGLAE